MMGCKQVILTTLISERWFWFVYKACKSYIKNDYERKKEKYKIKYNMTYQTSVK